jgi:hypothetical protein
VGSAVGNEPFAVTAFNASYTDSGLFGFVSSSPGNVAGQVRFSNCFVVSLQYTLGFLDYMLQMSSCLF